MTREEAVNWIINISADIGKIQHQDLWHYEQALSEIKDILEAEPEADVPDTNVGDMISRQAKSLEPKTKWILCTDQLPKIRYDVLITVWFHGTRQTKLGYRQQGEWMFWHEGNLESYLDEENKVIAWMPLPEPRKG